jgi:hypothetical protein
MLKKRITYFDYDGNERTEDFYFNLTKAECMEMELSTAGGLQQFIEKIVNEKDNAKIVEMFKEIILKSYGEKSPDGKRFYKSPEISQGFAATEAYSELFMELATDAEAATNFMNAVIPQLPEDKKKLKEFQNNVIPAELNKE